MEQRQILNQIDTMLQELLARETPKFTQDGPVGTTLDVISTKDLTAHQRVIMLYLIFNSNMESTLQRDIVEALGFSNKCVRENLNQLLDKGYVKRGTKVYSWELN